MCNVKPILPGGFLQDVILQPIFDSFEIFRAGR